MAGSSSGVSVSIPGCQVGEQFVTYTLVVSKGGSSEDGEGDSWTVRRRYQDFVKLHAAVKKAMGAAAELPELPPKKMRIGMSKFAPDFIEERRAKLENYIQRLTAVADPERVEALDDFLVYAEHRLKEAIEQLADVRELQTVVKMLRQAAEAAAAVHQKRAGQSGGAVRRRGGGGDSDEEEDDDDGGKPSPAAAGAAGADGPELLSMLRDVVRMLREYAVMLRGQTEDAQERGEATAASNSALSSRLRSRHEDIADAKNTMEALRMARAKECEKERIQLLLVSQQSRTVAAELRRVMAEKALHRLAAGEHADATAELRAALAEWERGTGAPLTVSLPQGKGSALSPLQQVASLCSRADAFVREVDGQARKLAGGGAVGIPTQPGAVAKGVSPDAPAAAEKLLVSASTLISGHVVSGPSVTAAVLLQSVAGDTASFLLLLAKLAAGDVEAKQQVAAAPASMPSPVQAQQQQSNGFGGASAAPSRSSSSTAAAAAATASSAAKAGGVNPNLSYSMSAGLNPNLAYGSGASRTSSAAPTSSASGAAGFGVGSRTPAAAGAGASGAGEEVSAARLAMRAALAGGSTASSNAGSSSNSGGGGGGGDDAARQAIRAAMARSTSTGMASSSPAAPAGGGKTASAATPGNPFGGSSVPASAGKVKGNPFA